MKILLMMTDNWTREWDREKFPNLQDWIDLYIGNTGNLMWMNGARFICSLPENEFDYYDWFAMHEREAEYKEEINQKYDAVVFPTANALQADMGHIRAINDLIRGIRIPIYFLGIGLTLTKGGTVEDLLAIIKEPFDEMIAIVRKSGGAFGVRGRLTKELFDKNQAGDLSEIIGCPSMYQNGLLKITKGNPSKEEFRVALNGKIGDFSRPAMKEALTDKNAVYICQDQYGKTLLSEYKGMDSLLKKHGYAGTKALANQKVRYFYRLDEWYRYMREQVDLSFGLRIHGNLISLLAGKPAVVYLPDKADLRISELAEYFALPTYSEKDARNLYDLFHSLDFTVFHDKFKENFEHYEDFLKRHGLIKELPREQTWLGDMSKVADYDTLSAKEAGYLLDLDSVKRDFVGMSKIKHFLYRSGLK